MSGACASRPKKGPRERLNLAFEAWVYNRMQTRRGLVLLLVLLCLTFVILSPLILLNHTGQWVFDKIVGQ